MAESGMILQRLVITFGRDPEIRVLYRTNDGPRPGTKKRKAEPPSWRERAYALAK